MLVVDDGFNLEVKDPETNPLEGYFSSEEPLLDDVDGIGVSGDTLGVFMYPKPENGIYEIVISGKEGKYQLDSYVYDVNGEVKMNKIKGLLNSEDDIVTLYLYVGEQSSGVYHEYFINMLNLINDRRTNIYKQGIYNYLVNHLTVANKQFFSGKTDLSIKLLEQMRDQIELLTPLGVEGGF